MFFFFFSFVDVASFWMTLLMGTDYLSA